MITSPGGPVGSYINALLKKRLRFKAGFNWGKGGGYQIVPLTCWCKILELYSVFTWRHGGNNNETAAMLVFQTNPVGVKLLSYVKAFFFPRHFHRRWLREWKRSIRSVLIREQDPWLGIYRDVSKTKPKEQPSNLEPRDNSNQHRFPLDFRHTFTVILPSLTRTLDNANSR